MKNASSTVPAAASLARLADLQRLRYPGRIIGIGRTPDGKYLLLNAITVRSKENQNRRFEPDKDLNIVTAFADPSTAPTDSAIVANLLYTAMGHDTTSACQIVGNGTQVSAAISAIDRLHHYPTLAEALDGQRFEDDSLGTPRLTAMLDFGSKQNNRSDPRISLSILAKSDHPSAEGDEPAVREAHYVETGLTPGYGLFLHTYMDEAGQVVSFRGDPLLLPIVGDTAQEVALQFWCTLDEEYRVAIVVRTFPTDFAETYGEPDTFIHNRFDAVPPAAP